MCSKCNVPLPTKRNRLAILKASKQWLLNNLLLVHVERAIYIVNKNQSTINQSIVISILSQNQESAAMSVNHARQQHNRSSGNKPLGIFLEQALILQSSTLFGP